MVDFNNLSIEYELRFLKNQPIYSLTYNILERWKVSSIKRSFGNRMYESNPRNDNFVDLTFDSDQNLITGRKIEGANDDIIFRLRNGLIVDIYNNQM